MCGLGMYSIWCCIQVAFIAVLTTVVLSGYVEEPNVSMTDDYEIVTPIPIDSEGLVISERSKRHARETDDDNKVYFLIPSSRGELRLELTPKVDLLAPGFRVYVRGNTTSYINHRKNLWGCLYAGNIKARPGTVVAVNICGGLNGMIKTETQDYLIQPLGLPSRRNDATFPHVLRRRSAISNRQAALSANADVKQNLNQTHYCGKKKRYMPRRPRGRRYWLPDEFPRPIKPRDTSHSGRRKRNVETLVVVDSDMVKKHGTDNVTMYVLTVFNMVASLYQDRTIGSNVSVALVGLVLLEGDEPGLSLTYNAEQSLNSFCQWQSMLRSTKGFHHDHAVLLTGRDICSWKNEPCDTLGYAPINGMCSRYRSCTINEDTGLALAFTVAHEIGHNFGMIHDGKGTACTDTRGSIMSPVLSGLDGTFSWSTCSRRDMAKFLESFRAYCLENEPRSIGKLQFPKTLPGEVYDANMQCKLQFGSHSKLCTSYSDKRNVCKALWCQKNGRECETKFLPAAEGTECEFAKWCRKGYCVSRLDSGPKPVNGRWGDYSDWSSCSRSCNGGVSYSKRKCNNPRPSNGGQYCVGDEKMYRICNVKPCSVSNPNFIQDHCNVFNNKTFKGKHYKWKLYHRDLGALSRCRAYCVPETTDMHLVLSTKLTNGVKCRPDDNAVCIQGECQSLGCDGIVESNVKPDICGICGGDNSSCQLIRGNVSVITSVPGYYEVMKIQKGARNIILAEVKESPAYFSLRNVSGHYYLSGKWILNWPGRYNFSGTDFIYRSWHTRELLKSKGPTKEDLIWEILSKTQINVSLYYEYVIPINRSDQPVLRTDFQHKWILTDSPCSRTCGLGIKTLIPKCYSSFNNTVSDVLCNSIPKPLEKQTNCSNILCPAMWDVGPWSPCNCMQRYQYRHVTCVRSIDGVITEKVPKHHCHYLIKPGRKRKCKKEKCINSNWSTGPWSMCHGDCNWGVQTRLVTCDKSSGSLKEKCNSRKRPPSIRRCRGWRCQNKTKSGKSIWIPGKWSKCSTTCGFGTQTREVRCANITIPRRQQQYNRKMSTFPGEIGSIRCQMNKKPFTHKPCNKPPCPEIDSICQDSYTWCHLVVSHDMCQRKMYGKKCCSTCKKVIYTPAIDRLH